MSPATPEDGGEATPAHGSPFLTSIICPACGFAIPPIARPVETHRALKPKRREQTGPIIPPTPPPDDPRYSPTDIIKRPDA